MEFAYSCHPHHFHYINLRRISWPAPPPPVASPASSGTPLNPTAAPFLPTAAPPLAALHPAFPHGYGYHHHPAGQYFCRPFPLGEKPSVKRGSFPYGGRDVRSVSPRLMLGPKHPRPHPQSPSQSQSPGWVHGPETKQRWVPKDSKLGNETETEKQTDDAAEDEAEAGDDVDEKEAEVAGLCGRTTVMMRHLPNCLKRQELIEILDDHCGKVNRRGAETRSEYDFVYLPIDYERKANKGYAFINFTSVEAAVRMCRTFDRMEWEGFKLKNLRYRTKKVCQICPAAIQGKVNLENSLSRRMFPSETFQPVAAGAVPRDGINGAPLSPVGILSHSLSCGEGRVSLVGKEE